MRTRRIVISWVAVLVCGGSILGTGAYAIHLRGESYRREVESQLAAFFRLPCEVNRIRGLTFSSRLFEGVVIHLPNRRDRVFECRSAIWREEGSGESVVNRLELQNGSLRLGSDRWQRGDYRTIFESGLGHDFSAMDLASVRLSDFDILFQRGDLSLACRHTGGEVDMSGATDGVARLRATELNGVSIPDGVSIDARFNVRNGVEVTDVALELPEVALSAIGLDAMMKGSLTQGRFSGTVRYSNRDPQRPPEMLLSGNLDGAALAELTRGLPLGPFSGEVSVQLESARISESSLVQLKGRGKIRDLSLVSFAPLVGLSSLAGNASIILDPVDVRNGWIDHARLEGVIRDISLQEVVHIWEPGDATGIMAIRINNLDFGQDSIRSADLEVSVLPPDGQAGVISRELVLSLARKFLNFSWPDALPQSLLPENLEYTQFGMRLVIRDNQLRILGSHGPKKDVILSIRVFGQTFGVVREQKDTIDLTPALDRALARLRGYQPSKLRDWLKQPRISPERDSKSMPTDSR